MESGDEINTRARAHISELEALLYSRAGTKPRPEPRVTATEKRIQELILKGMNQRKIVHQTASKSFSTFLRYSTVHPRLSYPGLAKTAASSSIKNTRGIHALVDKVDLHTRTLVRIEEVLHTIRRSVTKYDRPASMGELRRNPDLNPWLQGYLPFEEQTQVDDFFRSQERTFELNRYIVDTYKWDPNKFAPRIVEALCTDDYRIRYSYPGKST